MIKNVLSIPKHSSNDDTNVNSSVDIPILNESPECRDEPSNQVWRRKLIPLTRTYPVPVDVSKKMLRSLRLRLQVKYLM